MTDQELFVKEHEKFVAEQEREWEGKKSAGGSMTAGGLKIAHVIRR